MSTETPDAEAAWEERIEADFAKHPGSWRPDPQNWFREGWLAGYAARLDALHAENRAREEWWHNVSLNLYAERDEARAENQRLREQSDRDNVRYVELARKHDAARAERDALRDAITALADEWHDGIDDWLCHDADYYVNALRTRLSEAGEPNE